MEQSRPSKFLRLQSSLEILVLVGCEAQISVPFCSCLFLSLIEGQYTEVDEFASDCRLVIENCRSYYGGREEGRLFIEQAEQLGKVLNQQLDAFNRYLKSTPGTDLKAKAATKMSPTGPCLFPKPPVSLLMSILEDLRACNYTDKGTKVRSISRCSCPCFVDITSWFV